MIELNEFDIFRLKGSIYYETNFFEEALEQFSRALMIKKSSGLYYQIALCYCGLKSYKQAQESVIKAIKEEGTIIAYRLFKNISVGNLGDYETLFKVLIEGVNNHNPNACLCLHGLVIEDKDYPELRSELFHLKLLDKVYEYTPIEERTNNLLAIIKYQYRVFFKKYPYMENDNQVKELKTYKLCFENPQFDPENFWEFETVESLFDKSDLSNQEKVKDTLFINFNESSMLIFALTLLYEDYKVDKTITLINHELALTLFKLGSYKNLMCSKMLSLWNMSNYKRPNRPSLPDEKKSTYYPICFESMISNLIGLD